ncbi:flap endonuclease GEN [Macrosteles quadrilineatus]|uniref:flap endonuclease GEN n=1 Tax=Macrosteles quadrilineatus TaxID=74068 RepID=UPI0023E2233A|nr:flap endonuclease GEN [Macrosteles quadrilineatus]
MGVKDLWNILSPTCEKKSLWELQGLTIAIDLSSWIVDSQTVGDSSVMNMYLRNLFFRTSYLLLLGVKPIFIMEGKAPALKHDTIARRNQASKDNKAPSNSKNGNRGRLNCLQKKCEDLLLSLGVKCYKSDGEAEALCSRLNEVGIVDAVISQDSDCFLYGAKVVLRNFTMSPAYTCDMYTMKNIEEKLSLGRQKLLALSLICGCDYESGVHGVGKQSALKFLGTLQDDQVLDRLRSWRNDDFFDNLSQLSVEEKVEYNIRKKAIADPSFPSEEVIAEFLEAKSMDLPCFVWLKPSLGSFVGIADRLLAWDDDYITSKFLPLVTRWHLQHEGSTCGLKLETIIKKRSVRGVPSYELRWQHDALGEVTTVEPIELVVKVYSELHQEYVRSKEKPKKGKGRKKQTQLCSNEEMEDVENMLGKLDISGQKVKQPNKKRTKNKTIKGLQTMDRFLLKDVGNKMTEDETNSTQNLISHSTPVGTPTKIIDLSKSYHYLSDDSNVESPRRKNNCGNIEKPEEEIELPTLDFISFNDSKFDNSELNLSNIVDSIVARTSNNPAVKIWAEKMN